MALAQAGAKVVLTGRREGPLSESCDHINQLFAEPRAFYAPCDITDYSQIGQLVQEAKFLTGIPPTILINNAGVNVRKPAADLTSDDWHASLNLMLTAPFLLTRSLSTNMKEQGHGRVISIASLQSYRAFPDSIPYAAAKSGVLGLTRALSEAYSTPHGYPGVTVNAVAPGYVKTDLTASVFEDAKRSERLAQATLLGRNSEPSDLQGAVVFLCSPAADYITGQTLPVDGGFTALGLR